MGSFCLKYTVDVLCKFAMLDYKSMSTPMVSNLENLNESDFGSYLVDPIMYMQLIGSLMYLIHTRPDICFVVNALSQFMSKPRHRHWFVAKHVLRYLRGSIAFGLKYSSSGGVLLHGYVVSYLVGSSLDRKSTSGYCFSLGSAMISWSSEKQSSIAPSTTEAEYITASVASREAIWPRKLLAERLETTIIHCDNQSCLKLTYNPVFHDKSKHIEMKYHYIKDMVQKGAIKLQYIITDEQTTNILTKPLSFGKFVHFRDKLGVAENVSLAEREC
jgi:hypothetical protein